MNQSLRGMAIQCSVVIPTYNRAALLKQAVSSVLAQEGEINFEVIVVDDGSTDDTERQLGTVDDKRLVYVKKRNGGPGSARNYGVRLARSQTILFLDSDDRMLPGRVAVQAGFMLANPDVAATFVPLTTDGLSGAQWLSSVSLEGDFCGFRKVDYLFERLLCSTIYVPNAASAIRASVYEAIGGQREDLMASEDLDMWARVARSCSIKYCCGDFTWFRPTSAADQLTASPYAYGAPVIVLRDLLRIYGDQLGPHWRSAATKNLCAKAAMLFRYQWAEGRRVEFAATANSLEGLVPRRFIHKWRLLGSLPSSIPSTARRCLRGLRRKQPPYAGSKHRDIHDN